MATQLTVTGPAYSYPAYGYGYGTGYSYPAYNSGYASGYSYPAYSSGYASGYSYPAYGTYRAAYHPVIRRHIYASAAGIHHYRHWH